MIKERFKIIQVLEKSELKNFINNLHKGLDTTLGN